MKLLLQKDFQLRGYQGEPFVLKQRSNGHNMVLDFASFTFLLRCDGQTEINPDDWPKEPAGFREHGVIAPCEEGAQLLPDQKYILYPNKRMDYFEISITGYCNMNCKHCFHAEDASPLHIQPSQEQLLTLFRRMADYGVTQVRLTGGEPLVRKDFLILTEELARCGIALKDITTNASLITPELLDALEAQGHHPRWFLSLDGLGYHDWLRGVKGSEEKVKNAVDLIHSRNGYIQIHQCVWRDSMDSIKPTVLWAKEHGVDCYRMVPVEPSLRWLELAPNQTLDEGEWQDFLPGFLDWWYGNNINMKLDIWTYWMQLGEDDKRVVIYPDLLSQCHTNNDYTCRVRNFIDSNGRIVPCMPLSGITSAYGVDFGNVYEREDLDKMFMDPEYMRQIKCTAGQLKERNQKCRSCKWNPICSTGCRTMSYAYTRPRDLYGIDPRMCRFFDSGNYDKMVAIAEKYHLKYRP